MEDKNDKTTNENKLISDGNRAIKSGADMDEILLMSARQAQAKVTVQVKKQKFIAAIVMLEGAIALIAGILVLALTDMLFVGIPLLCIGIFITVAVAVLNARTIKKLKLMLDRAKVIQKQIAEGKFDNSKTNCDDNKAK